MATARRPPAEPDESEGPPNEDAAPVVGELVTTDAVIPSKDQQAKDGANRLARTGIQSGLAGAIVGVACWAFALAHIDLDPARGSIDLPPTVAGFFVTIITCLIAYAMNRPPKD